MSEHNPDDLECECPDCTGEGGPDEDCEYPTPDVPGGPIDPKAPGGPG